jgi:siderophore synthetase component
MTTLAPTALAAALATARAQLDAAAPDHGADLGPAFDAALPRATEVVARRLLGAAYREDLADVRGTLGRLADGVHEHAFDRAEPHLVRDPVGVLTELPERLGSRDLAVELADAVVKLALAFARPAPAPPAGLSADERAAYLERLSTDGHNLHPCGRTRLGWTMADALAYDLEAPAAALGFVAVRRDLHIGDDVGALLGIAPPSSGYAVQPVHAWQLDRIVRGRYPDLVASRALVPLDGVTVGATPTAALRTLLLDRLPGQPSRYLKVSLDIQVTSTRRTISVASTRNGPALSTLLHRLLAGEPRVLLLAEEAGAAGLIGARHRDLAAIVRRGLDGRLERGEQAVPGGALYATMPGSAQPLVADLVDRYATGRRLADRPVAAAAFLAEYARLLLPPLLRLATRHGIAIEAHLQNCVPTFRHGVPHRLALRDFAGLRVLRSRLAGSGHALTLWPESVIGTGDADVMRAKLAYTALQAHLGELVVRLVDSHCLDEDAAWRSVREVVDEVYDELRGEPAVAGDAAADHAFLTAPLVPHKALVRMRVCGHGDLYVPVRNPLR